jgi:predicted nucleic acid-binding protein
VDRAIPGGRDSGGLPDTSVFIADEQGRKLASDRLPDEAAISVVTLAELELGVHLAGTEAVRGRRLRTLQTARSTYVGLPVDEAVASVFAEFVASARRAGRRPKVHDTWIAATARAHDVAVYTQDGGFDGLPLAVLPMSPDAEALRGEGKPEVEPDGGLATGAISAR